MPQLHSADLSQNRYYMDYVNTHMKWDTCRGSAGRQVYDYFQPLAQELIDTFYIGSSKWTTPEIEEKITALIQEKDEDTAKENAKELKELIKDRMRITRISHGETSPPPFQIFTVPRFILRFHLQIRIQKTGILLCFPGQVDCQRKIW